MKYYFLFLAVIITCFSCNEDFTPKPKAYLRLVYPQAQYTKIVSEAPFTFETNALAANIKSRKLNATTESYGINIEYPTLKGTIFLTYKAINDSSILEKDFYKQFLNPFKRLFSKKKQDDESTSTLP